MHPTVIVPPEVAPGTILSCSRCGHKWAIRKRGALPKNCPKCRSILWLKKYYNYNCLKCGHVWGTANDSPQRCPKCHTSKWNTPATERTVRNEPVKSKLPQDLKDRIKTAYEAGDGCLAIARSMGLAFSDVMDVMLESQPSDPIRI